MPTPLPQYREGPLVALIDHTPYPLETMFSFWHASRTDAETLTSEQIRTAYDDSKLGIATHQKFYIGANPTEPFHQYFDREIGKIAGLDFPLKETITFSFVFSNVTITWREQAVRQRKATAWSQTSRTRNLVNWFDNHWYEEPQSVRADPVVHEKFLSVAASIQDFYRLAVSRHIHLEDARCLQPTCQTHRIAFNYDARVLEATMEDRLCFIAQAELWRPIVEQIRALVVGVDPRLAVLFHPPCIKGGKYRYCPVEHENERRVDGRDPMGPCPLWAMHEQYDWAEIPLRQNAEEQFARLSGMWPEEIQQEVTAYMAEEHKP